MTEHDGSRGPFLRVVVESALRLEACRTCGVVAHTAAATSAWSMSPCFGRQSRAPADARLADLPAGHERRGSAVSDDSGWPW